MSDYLSDRIDASDKIELLINTEIIRLEGKDSLEKVTWRNNRSGNEETKNIRRLFLMIGAKPNSDWLEGSLELDKNGFVCTDQGINNKELFEGRDPYHLETSLPGVFAVGDIRSESIKRVASAVGEGSVAVGFVHKWLKSKRDSN
jgi:thioredoxin reductase (NADPH)